MHAFELMPRNKMPRKKQYNYQNLFYKRHSPITKHLFQWPSYLPGQSLDMKSGNPHVTHRESTYSLNWTR